MVLIGMKANIKDRHVIVLEDIVDSGDTMTKVLPWLQSQQPTSIKLATLLKKQGKLKHDIKVDYTGFEISDGFVLGYGN